MYALFVWLFPSFLDRILELAVRCHHFYMRCMPCILFVILSKNVEWPCWYLHNYVHAEQVNHINSNWKICLSSSVNTVSSVMFYLLCLLVARFWFVSTSAVHVHVCRHSLTVMFSLVTLIPATESIQIPLSVVQREPHL